MGPKITYTGDPTHVNSDPEKNIEILKVQNTKKKSVDPASLVTLLLTFPLLQDYLCLDVSLPHRSLAHQSRHPQFLLYYGT